MRKLIFLLATMLLIIGLGIASYAADTASPASSDGVLANNDANFSLMTEGINGKSDGKAIPAEAFRNKNQLLIDFTNFQKYVEQSTYYPADDSLRNPAKQQDLKNPSEVEVKGDPNDMVSYNEEGSLDPIYNVTIKDMRYQNWIVELNSSADKIENRKLSYCKEVKRTNGEVVLGVRVHFPDSDFNAWAKVRPPFEIKAYKLPEPDPATVNDPAKYEEAIQTIQATYVKVYNPRFKDVGGVPEAYKDIYKEDDHAGYGIIDNVGQLKQISMEIYGLNQNIGVSVLFSDQFEEATEYFMGYLNFPGWRRLFWDNPNYITNIDHRNVFRIPLYPVERPYLKFDSIKLYRQGTEKVVNFVTYFRNIKVSYDFAVPPEAQFDVDDEAYWMILKEKYIVRAMREKKKAREMLYLRKQERARIGANEKPKDFVNPDSKW